MEATLREVKEETGLKVELLRLSGVYSNPHRLLEYSDGSRFHVVALNFEARMTGGALITSAETSEFTWCRYMDLETYDVMEHHLERIEDVISGVEAAFVR